MKIREFLKCTLLAAGLVCATSLQVSAQTPPATGGGGGGGGNRMGGILTQEQRTKITEAIGSDMTPLREKLVAAEKEVAKAALDSGVSDADFKAKVEAVQKIQVEIAVLRLKGVRAIASSLTDEQKTRLSNQPDGGYMMLFGGGFGGMGGRGGRMGGGGGNRNGGGGGTSN